MINFRASDSSVNWPFTPVAPRAVLSSNQASRRHQLVAFRVLQNSDTKVSKFRKASFLPLPLLVSLLLYRLAWPTAREHLWFLLTTHSPLYYFPQTTGHFREKKTLKPTGSGASSSSLVGTTSDHRNCVSHQHIRVDNNIKAGVVRRLFSCRRCLFDHFKNTFIINLRLLMRFNVPVTSA